MFTGIIESTANLISKIKSGTNVSFVFESNLTNELKIDQSLSHNGVCLTVEEVYKNKNQYQVTAIEETLQKTNLGEMGINELVNLERCMPANGRFDGHIVQGHVDQMGGCKKITDLNGSWLITVSYDNSLGNLTVEKGSICLNGISLTVINSFDTEFSVAIIPYTWQNTMLKNLRIGQKVNLEFDIIGKYIAKLLKHKI
jgi:riboflavin synthase